MVKRILIVLLFFSWGLLKAQTNPHYERIQHSKMGYFTYCYKEATITIDSSNIERLNKHLKYLIDSTNIDSVGYFVISSSLSKSHFMSDSLIDIKRQLAMVRMIRSLDKVLDIELIPPCDRIECLYPTLGSSSFITLSYRLKHQYEIDDIRIWHD